MTRSLTACSSATVTTISQAQFKTPNRTEDEEGRSSTPSSLVCGRRSSTSMTRFQTKRRAVGPRSDAYDRAPVEGSGLGDAGRPRRVREQGPGSSCACSTAQSPIVMGANVDERVYNRLEVGSPATFRPLQDGKTYHGTVVNLNGRGRRAREFRHCADQYAQEPILRDDRHGRHGHGRGARSGETERLRSDPTLRLPSAQAENADSRLALNRSSEFPGERRCLAVVDEFISRRRLVPTLATLGLFFICMALWPKPVTTARISWSRAASP